MPEPIGTVAALLGAARAESKAAEVESVRKAGGPVAWLRRRAPELLPLYPAGPTESEFFAESLAGWTEGAARARQCAKCPPHGGACDGSQNAWPDGAIIVADREKGIRGAPCPKWSQWSVWKLLGSTNVPENLRTLDFRSHIEPHEEALRAPFEEARNWGAKQWYVVRGGDARRHRKVVVSLLFELGVVIYQRAFWYDWAPRIAVGLREHMNDDSSVDLRHKITTVPVLAIDNLNPLGWKPWFLEAMDEILFHRQGKVTIIGSSRSVVDLQAAFPLSGDLIEEAVRVEMP